MSEMKDSGIEWIGEIPKGWKVSRIKQLFSEVNDRCENGENYTLLSVSEYYGVAPKSERISDDDMLTHAETLDGYKICNENDLVMNIMLAWKRALGVSEYTGIVSPAYCIYRGKQNMCAKYFHYLFRTDVYANLFKQYSTGIIDSRLRLYPDKFLSLKCQVPPLGVQRRIADYLDRKCSQIDAIIARQQEVIEKLKAYKLSVITEAVTKGLNPDVPMKDSGVEWIGEIPEHWTVSVLRYGLDNIQTGPFGSQLHAEDYIEDGIFVINPANIVEGCIVPDNRCSVTESKAQELSRHILDKGDIVFARRGEMGRCACFSGCSKQYLCGTGCIKIRCNANLMPEFISWFLQTSCVKQYLTLNSVGTTMANLNTTIISGIPVVYPPMSEQERIVKYIKNKIYEIDDALKNKLSIVDKFTEYKKSLIYEVVTGKKEV